MQLDEENVLYEVTFPYINVTEGEVARVRRVLQRRSVMTLTLGFPASVHYMHSNVCTIVAKFKDKACMEVFENIVARAIIDDDDLDAYIAVATQNTLAKAV